MADLEARDFTAPPFTTAAAIGINLMGYYYLNRIVFRPRPTLPASTIANYYIRYGDQYHDQQPFLKPSKRVPNASSDRYQRSV